MKITVLMLNGAQLEWEDNSGTFNLASSVAMWRSCGYIQGPHFYISMHGVGAILAGTPGAPDVKFTVPHGATMQ